MDRNIVEVAERLAVFVTGIAVAFTIVFFFAQAGKVVENIKHDLCVAYRTCEGEPQ